MKDATLALHHGFQNDPTTKAVAVPIYQTVAYEFDNAQHGADLFDLAVPGNIYTRIMNPTNDVLEKRLAALEGGIAALALASGMAAITYAIQTIAEAGDNIVSSTDLYGGTWNLFANTLKQFGIEVRFVDPADLLRLKEDMRQGAADLAVRLAPRHRPRRGSRPKRAPRRRRALRALALFRHPARAGYTPPHFHRGRPDT